jgi:N-glycosylase/DNA lyase
MQNLIEKYSEKKEAIASRINDFKSLNKKEYRKELLFCLLTPQSNAKNCWIAVQDLNKFDLNLINEKQISNILKAKTRFHNNKAKYIKEALSGWKRIESKLDTTNIFELREWLAENISGMGMKEASHFLRNIGKSNNQIAILDRHILKNLKALNIIKEDKIKNKDHYLKIEKKFIDFSKKVNIPIDHLDLLFWSQENGEIFK